MRKTLPRLLRLRALLEEESRIRLEKLVQRATFIERAREREEVLISASRCEAFSLLSGSVGMSTGDSGIVLGQTAVEAWITAVTDGDMAHRREQKLAALAQVAAGQVEAGRDAMFRLRRERQQVETLLHSETTRRKVELERRKQRELDDWFAAMRDRRRRSVRNGNTAPRS